MLLPQFESHSRTGLLRSSKCLLRNSRQKIKDRDEYMLLKISYLEFFYACWYLNSYLLVI